MTRREQMRERAASNKSDRGERQEWWPPLIPVKYLKLSRSERISLAHGDPDFHHATPWPAASGIDNSVSVILISARQINRSEG